MAAQLHPPGDDPLTAAGAPSDDPTAAEATAPIAPAPALLLPAHPEGVPSAPKRQRRPSVRLGEIGDQPATLAYEPHPVPRRGKQQSWRAHREAASASSKSVKARSLVHLVNGEEPEGANLNGDAGGEFGQRRKARRGPSTKRVRSSSWVSSKVEELGEEERLVREEEEGFREFDSDSDSQVKLQESPLPSYDNENNEGAWGHRGGSGGGEGVRSWLIELGLSRYAPVFEVHEVDDEVLPFLTLEDLKDMGINAVGSRRKLFSAIQKLRRGYS